MAASVASVTIASTPHCIRQLTISSIEAGAKITASHGGPSGVAPLGVSLARITTEATSGSPVRLEWVGQSTSNNTVDIRLDTDPGGDLTGAVVTVNVEFIAHASGGLINVA